MAAPPLTIVVPALNEAGAVGRLLGDLARQQGVGFEVVLADGGSRDHTPRAFAEAAGRLGLAGRVAPSPPGRGRQLNAGARGAAAPDLLFLHADSGLADPGLLARAAAAMAEARTGAAGHRVAGHFGVRFLRTAPGWERAYYFYEAKTRLGRPETVNGDQGFWLSRAYWEELGGFDEALPYMEDARLARRVFETGRWLALPGWLGTSARRFEVEGLRERQTLNAILRCLDAIGCHDYLAQAPGAYRAPGEGGNLRLGPFLGLAHRSLLAGGGARALGWWWRVGGYVARNAWQLAFALDCDRNRRRGREPGQGPTPWLGAYDRWLAPLAATPVGAAGAGLATAAWLVAARLRAR
ncbi:MAG: glycosyltransferase [Deferrisomatales bacterium]